MEKRGSIQETDPLLRPFLQSSDDAECERLLSGLVSNHASPLIKDAIWFKLRALSNSTAEGVQHQEAEDIHSEAIFHLVGRLRDLQANPDIKPISNFRSYVAVVSYNACNEHLRRKYPLRHSLKNRLRYVLTHQPGMSLWQSGGELVCGYSEWQARGTSPASGDKVTRLRDDPSYLEREGLMESARRDDLSDLATVVLESVGGPIELDDLVGIVAGITGVRDLPAESARGYAEDQEESLIDRTADPRPSFSEAVEDRLRLNHLWKEIGELPLRQRLALLLNLKDDRGESQIEAFTFTGVATIRQIARVLEMTAEELARIWNELPMEDSLIAERLQLTRQQIINLRKGARQRLAKRMREAAY